MKHLRSLQIICLLLSINAFVSIDHIYAGEAIFEEGMEAAVKATGEEVGEVEVKALSQDLVRSVDESTLELMKADPEFAKNMASEYLNEASKVEGWTPKQGVPTDFKFEATQDNIRVATEKSITAKTDVGEAIDKWHEQVNNKVSVEKRGKFNIDPKAFPEHAEKIEFRNFVTGLDRTINVELETFSPEELETFKKLDPAGKEVIEAQNKLAEAQGEDAVKNAREELETAQKNLEGVQKDFDKTQKDFTEKEKIARKKYLEAREDYIKNPTKESRQEFVERSADLDKTVRASRADAEVFESKQWEVRRQEEINLEKKVKDIKKQYKEAKENLKADPENKALRERVDVLKEKVESFNNALDEFTAEKNELAERLAKENKLSVRQRMTAMGDRITVRTSIEKVFSIAKSGLSLIIVGLVFSLGNYITGTIQEAFMAKTRHDTLKKPQRFADIWMQIPNGFLTAADKPAPDVSLYLYVGIDADPKDNSVGRSKAADTDERLKIAPIFIPTTKFDEWGHIAITDPRFPGLMVHADTGFNFVSGGEGVPGEEVIQFFGAVPHGGESLQFHLDQLEGYATKGFSSKAFFEYREESAGYKGEPVIGNRFDQDLNTDFVKKMYPDYAQEGESWGSVLNNSMSALYHGVPFENYHVRPIRALSDEELKQIGGSDTLASKPYFGFGKYIYETADTPNIKSVRANLKNDPQRAALADKIVEYVLMVDDAHSIVPLEEPRLTGQYNYPSYELNLKARKMLSIFDGLFYEEGKTSPSGMDVSKMIANYFPEGMDQIKAMKSFVDDQLKYGPFVAGDVRLTIDKRLQDAGVPVYKVANKLEDGQDDYVVATKGLDVITLPGSPSHYVSLVTSRIYDSSFIPYDKKHAGKKDMAYTVYKKAENKPPLVVVGPPKSGFGTPITQGLSAPLYSLFMDPDVNPNKIDSKSVNQQDAQWLAGRVGKLKNSTIQWPLPIPVPDQWALSDHGPSIAQGGSKQRIGEFLSQKASDLKKTLDSIHEKWMQFMVKQSDEDLDQLLGIFPWASTELRTINIRATGADDVKRGNYIYTSPYYPGEYLVLAKDKAGTQGLGKEFDVAEPQPYLLSLSNGNVYARPDGEPVDTVDVEDLLNRVKQAQGGMSSSLEQAIKSSQAGVEAPTRDPYGSTVNFGPYTFYLFKEDADRKQYVYADVSNIKDYREQAKKGTLLNNVQNFYVGIELKEGVGEAGENNPANWIYGKPLGPKTFNVLSMVDGILYSRSGSYQGYIKPFSNSLTNNLDIRKGYLDLVFEYLKKTWQQIGKQTELRSTLKNRIVELTQNYYNLLLKQKEEIEQAELLEERLNKPMDPNLLSNINAQPYVEEAQRFGRNLKKYRDAFYAVDPDVGTVTDFNVGDQNKDNKVGIVYTKEGKPTFRLYNWALNSARAYNGIYVHENGKQELDVMLDHPAIPMDGMIKLSVAAVKDRYEKAQKALIAARDAYAKNPDKATQDALSDAAIELTLAQRLYSSARAVEDIKDFEFYFNKNIGLYFVKDGTRFVDLLHGYEFNVDGSVRLSQRPVLISDQPTKDILFVGTDSVGLFVAEFKGDRPEYARLFLIDETPDAKRPETLIRYTMAAITGEEYYIYRDKEKNDYAVFKVEDDGTETSIGIYSPSPSLAYSQVSYMSTGQGPEKGTYVEADSKELNPTYIIWDGGPTLNLKQVYYRKHLISLTKQGDSFTGTYKDEKGASKTITVKEQVVKHGEETIGHYLSITEGAKTYNFMYLAGVVDFKHITACEKEQKIEHLDMWKECTWEINILADTYGVSKIIKSLPKRLPRVPADDVARVKAQAGKRAPIAQANIDKVNYDPKLQRYVYQISSRDEGWPYYDVTIEDWYVDLKTGIVYDPKAPAGGSSYPSSTLILSQLFILLDRLELSVSQIQRKDGSIGDGLVYRTPMVVTEEEGKMKVLNQQIVDLAEGRG